MTTLPADKKISLLLSGMVGLIIALVPFHAFLTVWFASVFGHYTVARLWEPGLLVVAWGLVIYLLARNPKLRGELVGGWLFRLIFAYVAVQIIWGAVALNGGSINAKAFGYALVINTAFLLFFVAVYVAARRGSWLQNHWGKLVLWPAAVVVGFGLLQNWVLPVDFLRHFGYGPQTIYPFETINHNAHYVRIISTLRGANPLGAYLIIIVSVLAVLLRRRTHRWPKAVLFVASLYVLFLSFSRSAWLGAALALVLAVWWSLKTARAQRLLLGGAAVLIVLTAAVAVLGRHNTTLSNTFFHTSENSTIAESSNEGHVSALLAGIKQAVREPLGRGPGSAGPASVYNNHPARIAENYFVQIAQETGWLGLGLFVAINVLIIRALWQRREQPLARALLASLAGIILINLLEHAWTDPTLSYLWWGLAGLAIAPSLAFSGEAEKSQRLLAHNRFFRSGTHSPYRFVRLLPLLTEKTDAASKCKSQVRG